jgi:hypothetical protein
MSELTFEEWEAQDERRINELRRMTLEERNALRKKEHHDAISWLLALEKLVGAAAELKLAIRNFQDIKMTDERWRLLEPIGKEVTAALEQLRRSA